ncbi:MAG: hypothetical protein ACYTDW_17290 [Planctomycetota bacterium]
MIIIIGRIREQWIPADITVPLSAIFNTTVAYQTLIFQAGYIGLAVVPEDTVADIRSALWI